MFSNAHPHCVTDGFRRLNLGDSLVALILRDLRQGKPMGFTTQIQGILNRQIIRIQRFLGINYHTGGSVT